MCVSAQVEEDLRGEDAFGQSRLKTNRPEEVTIRFDTIMAG